VGAVPSPRNVWAADRKEWRGSAFAKASADAVKNLPTAKRQNNSNPLMPRILTILADGFEEIEATTPIDLLRRAGAEVTIASLSEKLNVTGRCGLTLLAETPLDRVPPALFDCLFLPGGPGVRHLRANPLVRERVLAHDSAQRWIAAICAAPTVLLDAGILARRRFTAHFSVAVELPSLLEAEDVVVDGHIVTSRGAGTALDLGLTLVAKLFSAQKAAEIARSICVGVRTFAT